MMSNQAAPVNPPIASWFHGGHPRRRVTEQYRSLRNRAMWDEDPSYQNSNFRFLVGTVLCALLAGPIVALWTGDWGFYQGFLGLLAAGVTVWPGA